MMLRNTAPARFLGFDVAKDTITVATSDKASPFVVDNDRPALRKLVRTLGPECFAVLEPTGGHEALLLGELLAAGIACHRADTLKVKAFIRSYGTLGKTDAIDAARLCDYGRERWSMLPLFEPKDIDLQRLQDIVRRRRELVDMKVAERNRARAPGAAELKASFKAILAAIEAQIASLDKAIEALVAKSRPIARRVAVCIQMKGLATLSAVSLLALMPELGTLTRRQAAALAGVAPHPNESGTLKGYRRMRGGRPEVRTALFMPAMAASRAKGPFADFYNRLLANGKKPIVAIAALMRKIVVTLNAKLRDAHTQQS